MSFIIKGFDTDGNCLHCYFQSEDSDRCILTDDDIPLYGKGHPNSCPLIPLPEGHGRLVDAERFRVILCRLKERQNDDVATHALNWAIECLDKMDTIIPAEGGTDECSEN